MRTYPRIRRVVRQGGPVVCVLLLIGWVVSWWWSVGVGFSPSWISIGWGILLIRIYGADPDAQGLYFGATGLNKLDEVEWALNAGWDAQNAFLALPLWIPLLMTLITTAAVWRCDVIIQRRTMGKKCSNCNYNRTGLAPSAICPECGTAAPARSAKP